MLVGGARRAASCTGCAARRNAGEIERARGCCGRVGIDHLERAEARNLSYGQQKLLELAGVLMADPETIMLDEPAGGVNPALIGRIGTLVRELNAEGQTFVIVEHNMDLVMSLSDHVVVFDRGRPIAEGAAVGRSRPTRECWRPTLASETRLPPRARRHRGRLRPGRPGAARPHRAGAGRPRSSAWSAPTAPASPPCSRSPAACSTPRSGTIRVGRRRRHRPRPAADARAPGSPTCCRATASSAR